MDTTLLEYGRNKVPTELKFQFIVLQMILLVMHIQNQYLCIIVHASTNFAIATRLIKEAHILYEYLHQK